MDVILYNILRLNVKGSKCEFQSSVMFPSYVQGTSVLYKHMEIDRTDRKIRAFAKADVLAFHGDVHLFQIKVTTTIRELFAAKCSIMDYARNKIMHAFDGKDKSFQYKIATDINSMQVNDDTNVSDTIQGYCDDIVAVGDDRHQKIIAVDSQEGCGYCGIRGHTERECRRKKADERSGNSTGRAGRFQGTDITVTNQTIVRLTVAPRRRSRALQLLQLHLLLLCLLPLPRFPSLTRSHRSIRVRSKL